MHVLSVIHYPTYGGPHQRNAALSSALRARRIEITLVIPDEPGNAYEHLATQNVRVIRMPMRRLRRVRDPRTHLRFASEFRADVRRLRGLMRRLDVDVVLVNGLVNPHAAIAGHLEGRAVVWQILDTAAPMAVRRVMMPMVTGMADAIMSSGRPAAEEHPGAVGFGERLVPFFSVVDTERFVPDAERRRAARDLLGIQDDRVVVGNVNNINLMKGHDLFVTAAGELHRRRPNTCFVILGAQNRHHGDYIAGLWRTADSLGLRMGHDLIVRDPGTKVELLAPAFDVFWLTSPPRSEGVSTVVGEAMALELPVVATRVGSVSESIADGVTGNLVAPGDAGALVDATLPYVDDEQLRRKVGSAGRARAKELYSREVCADRHELAFRLAMRHRGLRNGHDRGGIIQARAIRQQQ